MREFRAPIFSLIPPRPKSDSLVPHYTSTSRALAFLLILAFLLAGCQRPPEYRRVTLSSSAKGLPTHNNRDPEKPPFRLAISSVVSPKETIRSYQALITYLSQKLGRPVELVQRGTYAETNDLLQSGNVDLAMVCTYAYILGHREFGMELLAVPKVAGKAVYESNIIVSADSNLKDFRDLRGKVFAFTDPISFSGTLYPTYLLSKMGETRESFFQRYIFTYSHDNSIKAVGEKLVHAAAVDSLILDYALAKNPAYRNKIRVIGSSPSVGSPPVVVNPNLDKTLKDKLQAILLEMHNDPQGQEALREIMVDRFALPDDRAYDFIRQIEKATKWEKRG
ncbi:MAG: phosphate/phosphite/phosphonate ABC transporter substrate-binding protein [Firmicutes bacterium]|nr:phosphate/phosphite/phosphonate ABC transporter substrate-binding protein [Bacillota bacterium]MCL5038496.1 phosphate/phosphite/phosphonate ABC transporter substrate-binding protein [Bacillota bacterium]